MSKIMGPQGIQYIVSAQNDGKVSVHRFKSSGEEFKFRANEFLAEVEFENGNKLRREAYYGSGYLSQNSRYLVLPDGWKKITFITYDNKKRIISSQKK